jgi:hypothetical protein
LFLIRWVYDLNKKGKNLRGKNKKVKIFQRGLDIQQLKKNGFSLHKSRIAVASMSNRKEHGDKSRSASGTKLNEKQKTADRKGESKDISQNKTAEVGQPDSASGSKKRRKKEETGRAKEVQNEENHDPENETPLSKWLDKKKEAKAAPSNDQRRL